jgi:hypothetical protein
MAEYRFKIDAYTPETIPMARLAEYMADFAKLFGENKCVHFVAVENGSANLVSRIDEEVAPKIRERVYGAARGEAPREAIDALRSLGRRLREDKSAGALIEEKDREILRFSNPEPEPIDYGGITQAGSLDGILIVIGGTTDPVPAHIQAADQTRTYNCYASRALAKQLAPYLFGTELRVHGSGRWFRDADDTWKLDRFNIESFEVLGAETLSEALNAIRAISGSEWQKLEDPWATLWTIRNGRDGDQ